MSTLCEIPFEPLQCDGSNYYSWSAHVLNALRALGPFNEQVVETSILPKDFDFEDLSTLSNEERDSSQCNFIVTSLLFNKVCKVISDYIKSEEDMHKIL